MEEKEMCKLSLDVSRCFASSTLTRSRITVWGAHTLKSMHETQMCLVVWHHILSHVQQLHFDKRNWRALLHKCKALAITKCVTRGIVVYNVRLLDLPSLIDYIGSHVTLALVVQLYIGIEIQFIHVCKTTVVIWIKQSEVHTNLLYLFSWEKILFACIWCYMLCYNDVNEGHPYDVTCFYVRYQEVQGTPFLIQCSDVHTKP